jgi:hypothetical protein
MIGTGRVAVTVDDKAIVVCGGKIHDLPEVGSRSKLAFAKNIDFRFR